jgi:NADH dehydrogenase FAD-containing subunit
MHLQSRSVMKISDHLEEIAVYERRADFFRLDNPAVHLIEDSVTAIDTSNKRIYLHSGMYC